MKVKRFSKEASLVASRKTISLRYEAFKCKQYRLHGILKYCRKCMIVASPGTGL